jgi:acyl-CoA synthetase (AMP-forming)/AMP-acid ligase II
VGCGVEASVVAHAREHLAGYKVPRSFDVVEQMPRSEAGKLLKRQLRTPYWEGSAARSESTSCVRREVRRWDRTGDLDILLQPS